MGIRRKTTGFTPAHGLSAALVALFLPAAGPARALVSTAGGYELESSVHDSGGSPLSGSGYVSKGAAGQRLPDYGPGTSEAGGYANRSGFYNPPHFTFQKGLAAVVPFNSGQAALTLPPGAVGKEVFDITLNPDPVTEPLAVDPSLIVSANLKMEANEGGWGRLFPENISEMAVFDEQSRWDRPFEKSGLLAMHYKDSNSDGILDGSNPPVRVETIRPWALDESMGMWAKLPASSYDNSARLLTVPLLSPGVFALLGTLDDSVRNTYAFPVPFRPGGPDGGAGAGQTGTETEGVTFANVPQAGDIEIYTLDGRLVRKLSIPTGLAISKLKWDVRTAAGARAASGVYIWRVVSGPNSKTGKLMIIW